jgi:hypothetical protein
MPSLQVELPPYYGLEQPVRAFPLLVRYAVQDGLDRTASLAVELLGAGAFIPSPEVSYLLTATRVLSLHPPSRLSASKRLNEYLGGSPLVLD